MTAQVGPGYRANHTGTDITGTPLRTLTSVARHYNGFDSNNNGRNFGLRPATPGVANALATVSSYAAPNVDATADGATVSGYVGSFVGSRVITPGVVSASLNPNAISAPPVSATAIISWDNSGGGKHGGIREHF